MSGIALAVSLIWISCQPIDGKGAVELSWALRDFDGESIPQACPLSGESATGIGEIELCWQPLGDAGTSSECDEDQLKAFLCERNRGVTSFVVEPGPTQFFLRAICRNTGRPADQANYMVPPPLVREVQRGGVVTLNQLLIVTETGAECPCPSACTIEP